MSTPPQVQSQLDALIEDVYRVYVVGHEAAGSPYDPAVTQAAAVFMARWLMRWGWCKGELAVPLCPNDVAICFDADPHPQCEIDWGTAFMTQPHG